MTTHYDEEQWKKYHDEQREIERRRREKAEAEWDKNTHVEVKVEVGYRKVDSYLIRKEHTSKLKSYLMRLT